MADSPYIKGEAPGDEADSAVQLGDTLFLEPMHSTCPPSVRGPYEDALLYFSCEPILFSESKVVKIPIQF